MVARVGLYPPFHNPGLDILSFCVRLNRDIWPFICLSPLAPLPPTSACYGNSFLLKQILAALEAKYLHNGTDSARQILSLASYSWGCRLP